MLVKNARIYLNGRLVEKDILIENGIIRKIGKIKGKGMDAKGYLVLPGLIDPHVHLRDMGMEYKEDFESGTKAAVAGGFTTVLDMPNNKNPITTYRRYKEKIKKAERRIWCDVGFHFGGSKGNLKEVKKVNPLSLKIFMGKSTGNLLLSDEYEMWKHFHAFDKRKPIVVHAEDEGMLMAMEKMKIEREPMAEWIAVEKALSIAEYEKRNIYVAHVSTLRALKRIKEYGKGFAEASPHHLFLDEKRLPSYLKGVNPPLRNKEERRMLWKNLELFDSIGSDHAPHTLKDKRNGAKGFPGLETSFHLFFDAYRREKVSLEWIVKRMAENPARIFGLKKRGIIGEGYFGDLVLVNPKKEWIVKAEEMNTKAGWSPFEGRKLRGKVEKVILRGGVIYEDGEFIKRKGVISK